MGIGITLPGGGGSQIVFRNPRPTGWDFNQGMLSAGWNELDISSIVPVDARAVLVSVAVSIRNYNEDEIFILSPEINNFYCGLYWERQIPLTMIDVGIQQTAIIELSRSGHIWYDYVNNPNVVFSIYGWII
jgi:hypothetical protein